MKVTAQDFEVLRGAIAPLDTPERRMAYNSGDFARADRVRDIDKRYRWDLFYDARRVVGFEVFDFVSGYTNEQIDTALRRIVEEVAR